MANLFRRLLGGQEPSPELVEALVELDRAILVRPSLEMSATVLRDILPALCGQPVEELAFAPQAANEKLSSGVPILRGENLAHDRRGLRARWLDVCRAVERRPGGEPAEALAKAVDSLEPASLLNDVLGDRADDVRVNAETLQLDPGLTLTVLRLSALPMLARLGSALASLRQASTWDRGNCPTCGAWPLLGEFRGLEQVRMLRCGWCATGWEFPRLRCPFCDNRDHRLLGFFHAEGENVRASTCDQCHGYVKMIFTLSALSTPMLLVKDLATLHLDLIAADRGFLVP